MRDFFSPRLRDVSVSEMSVPEVLGSVGIIQYWTTLLLGHC